MFENKFVCQYYTVNPEYLLGAYYSMGYVDIFCCYITTEIYLLWQQDWIQIYK